MLTPVAGALRREDTVPADRESGPAVADTVPVSVRPERALLLLGLASRTAYLLYASAVVLFGLSGYRHPGMAGAALGVAVLASAGLGFRVWREQAFSELITVLDAAVAIMVLILMAGALQHPDQSGSLNWALSYAVASAVWLGLSGWLSWRIVLACLLGAVYGVTALRGGAVGPALTITAVVNAASAPMYFGIAAAVTWVVRRIAAEMAAERARERTQRRGLAALTERERLVGQVHQSVLATLEQIASGQVPWTELRGRAKAQVSELRRAFGEPAGTGQHAEASRHTEHGQHAEARQLAEASHPEENSGPPGASARDGLRALLAGLARDRSSDGWRLDVIDEELTDEPPPAEARALRDALAELITGPAPEGCAPVRAQVRAGGAGTELVARVARDGRAMTGAVAAARARLAPAGGTAEPMPARPGEMRVSLQVPA
jgi:hypothetical protein